MITTISILAIIAYLMTFSLIFVRFRRKILHIEHSSSVHLKVNWGAAILLHGYVLYVSLFEQGTLSLGLAAAVSHVLLLISVLLFYTTFKCKIETLGLFIIPAVIVSIITTTFFPVVADEVYLSGGLGVHIFTSLLAYSVLLLATMQALLLAYQNKNLHKHKTSGLISTLPALQDMEALLFRLIKLGLVLLTISLLTGFIFLDGFFQKGIAHKTVFSVIAWFIFSGLLYGHYQYGWRGRIAVRWALFGSAFLLLAYFGSKFVFEYLLS